MYGEKSIYQKMQVILEYAKEDKHTDERSLGEYIEKRKPTNFLTSWRNKKTDTIEHRYSRNSIERAMKICKDLKLLEGEAMVLSSRGRSAIDPRRFQTIVGSSTREYLETSGISLNSILNSISTILHSKKPCAPTSEEIWENLGESKEKISLEEFRRLMTLLGQCQIVSMSQRRIFLPWSSRH
jgi:hypothetical protein